MNKQSLYIAARALARNLDGAQLDWADRAAVACIKAYLQAESRRKRQLQKPTDANPAP
jgi:hypothetical protein